METINTSAETSLKRLFRIGGLSAIVLSVSYVWVMFSGFGLFKLYPKQSR